jgi:DNA polymerase I-like protein with 3'-5' exonuclease and polymerase domains
MTLYGGGAYSMADQYFDGDVNAAQKQLDDFFTAFPGLKTWMEWEEQ